VRDAVTAAPLAATVSVGPYSTTSDGGTGAYSIQVPEGIYDLSATAAEHGRSTVTAVTLGAAETRVEDFVLWPYLEVLSDSVENGSVDWTAQSPWAITSAQSHSSSP
jgi:hypothetical protein